GLRLRLRGERRRAPRAALRVALARADRLLPQRLGHGFPLSRAREPPRAHLPAGAQRARRVRLAHGRPLPGELPARGERMPPTPTRLRVRVPDPHARLRTTRPRPLRLSLGGPRGLPPRRPRPALRRRDPLPDGNTTVARLRRLLSAALCRRPNRGWLAPAPTTIRPGRERARLPTT